MIDLHIHSNISVDGELPIEDILELAERKGVKAISITDHNSALAHVVIEHINKDKYFSGKVISGVEIDACEDGLTFELLAYNFDVHPVQDWLYKKFGTVSSRQKTIRDKLMKLCEEKGFKIDENYPWEPKSEFAHINVYNNLIQFSENKKRFGINIVDGSDFYRNSTSNKNFALYMDMSFLWGSVDEINQIIHKNKGVTSLAHTFGYSKDLDTDKLLKLCVEKGVDGIEVYHPKHSQEQKEFLLKFCKKHNLLITGGSDFHKKENEADFGYVKNDNLLELSR